MRRFADDQATEAFRRAIERVEGASAAEIVVAVRHHSGSYLHADVIVGAAAAFGALAFMLFSRFEFGLWAILLDPFLAGGLVGLFATQLPAVRRWLTPAGARRRRVRAAAQAAFFERGVRLTRARTGVLVYVSLLERAVEVVADRGVTDAIPAQEWQVACAPIERALRATMNGVAVADAIGGLADVCAAYLERGHDDANELADEVSTS